MPASTPMMLQYKRIKEKSGNAVLFFRLGDFYEMFEEDAKEASRLLGLTLTQRNGVPMCGIPYHASQTYIAKLLKFGKKIAVCEQLTEPGRGKTIVERDIVEIISPGTVLQEEFLDKTANNFLAAVGVYKKSLSFSYVDSSTGDFFSTSYPYKERVQALKTEFQRLLPREIIIQDSLLSEDADIARFIDQQDSLLVNRFPDWSFDIKQSAERLKRHFGM
ncbi:MAG: DNA mismatch repair protein MutS, partial [Spirochaetales bacterium]